MTTSSDGRFDVVAMGNAIVDVLATVEDGFLPEQGIEKGIMTLIDTARAAQSLYESMGPAAGDLRWFGGEHGRRASQRSGARTAFVGKVRDDQLGRIFAHDIRAQGAHYEGPVAAAEAELETARSFVLVSPDGQRSMNTYLGIAGQIGPDDIDERLMHRADWLYLEGYLFDLPAAKEAFRRATAATRSGGGKVALTVSDPFCVERHRADFHELIRASVDLLFANEAEALSLAETEDLGQALDHIAGLAPAAVVTRSEQGAVVVRGAQRLEVPTEPLTPVDTTGAGDLFASGFLFGTVTGRDDMISARMGSAAAAEIISHIGARPKRDLKVHFAEQGLL